MILLENQRANYEKDYTVLKYLEIKRILEYLRTKKNCSGLFPEQKELSWNKWEQLSINLLDFFFTFWSIILLRRKKNYFARNLLQFLRFSRHNIVSLLLQTILPVNPRKKKIFIINKKTIDVFYLLYYFCD